MPKNANMIERFWEKVAVAEPDECWEWTGAIRWANGYGVISAPGNNRVQMYAHRLSAAIHFGTFSRLTMVCHHCDTPQCVNPAHLYLGDAKSNSDDMMRRDRGRGQFVKGTFYPSGQNTPRLAGSTCEGYR